MLPTISLKVAQSVRLPEDPTEMILLIGNPGAEPLKTALPQVGWWEKCHFKIVKPDGSAEDFEPFKPKYSPAVSREPLIISEGAEIEKSFLLEGLADVDASGWYRLEGVLEFEEEILSIAPVKWFVEAPGPIELAIPLCHGVSDQHETVCWVLFHGERISCLSSRAVIKNDISSAEPVGLFSSVRHCETASGAYALVATESFVPGPPQKEQWVAWLAGRTFYAGVAFELFNSVSFDLPGAPGRILSNLLPNTSGGIDAFILRKDGRELWVIGIGVPELKAQPFTDATEIDGEASTAAQSEITVVGVEDASMAEDPHARVLMPIPKLLSSLTPPIQSLHGAVARTFMAEKDTAGVLLLTQKENDLVAHYAVVREGCLSSRWHNVVIPDAQLLPDADPALVFESGNIARAAVLFQAGSTDDNSGRLGIAHLAFGPEGQLLYVDGIGRRDLVPLTRQPISAGMVWFMDDETGERRCDWSVVFSDNTCLFCRGENKPEHLDPFDDILLPPKLLPALEYTALATRRPEGALGFVCID